MSAPTWSGATTHAGATSGTTLAIPTPAAPVNGDVVVVAVRAQGVLPVATPVTLPTDWVRAGDANGSGDRAQGIFYKIITAATFEPASYTFGGWGAGRSVGSARILKGVNLADPIAGSTPYSLTNPAAYDTDPAPYLIVAAWGDERTSPRSMVPSATPAGYGVIENVQSSLDASTTGSRTALWWGSLAVEDGGATTVSAASLTWPDGVSANRAVSVAFRGIPTVTTPGLPIETEAGTGYLTYMDGGVEKTPASLDLWMAGFPTVTAALAKAGATASHRGGSSNWPEYSEIAYDRSVMRGYGILEFSCGWTSDNVPFGLGDEFLDRAAGVTGSVNPTSMTWATLSSTYQNQLRPVVPGVYQPFYKLEDFLIKYTPLHVVLVDPKFGWSTPAKVAEMLRICNAHGGPSRIIIKYDFPVTDPQLVNAAKAAGYTTMNYWGTNQAALTPTYHTDKWDLIGVAYDADQAMYDAANAIGKPVWAAVAPNQAGYNTAISRGADLVMVSNPLNVTPVSVR